MLFLINSHYTQAAQVNDTSRNATATVSITILDINDNIPIFNPVSYIVNVSETTSIGEKVLNVSATDRDEVSAT